MEQIHYRKARSSLELRAGNESFPPLGLQCSKIKLSFSIALAANRSQDQVAGIVAHGACLVDKLMKTNADAVALGERLLVRFQDR